MSGRFKILLTVAIASVLISTPTLASSGAASVTDYVCAFWPIFLVSAGLVATGVLLGLATRFPTMAAFKALKDRVLDLEKHRADHDGRLKMTENYCGGVPSRQDLQEDVFEVSERVKGLEVGVVSIGTQLNTMNTYLHTLIEKGVR